MTSDNNIKNRVTTNWEVDNIHISHSIIDYKRFGRLKAINDTEYVRLHFGLQGSYEFNFAQLDNQFDLSGHHNNIMYSNGLDLEVFNKSNRIETFGINFDPATFIKIGQNGNDLLKRFTEKVVNKQNTILADNWKTSNFKIQQVIKEIIQCTYKEELQKLFLLSKTIELLVLQAELYENQPTNLFIKSAKDRKKLIEAKELLDLRLHHPPTIIALAKLIGINEYKLKKGFKELFGTTIFGYIFNRRMNLAQQLLLDTTKSVKEVAYQIGYSSPQHFSYAFKQKFGQTPNSVRKNPDSAIR